MTSKKKPTGNPNSIVRRLDKIDRRLDALTANIGMDSADAAQGDASLYSMLWTIRQSMSILAKNIKHSVVVNDDDDEMEEAIHPDEEPTFKVGDIVYHKTWEDDDATYKIIRMKNDYGGYRQPQALLEEMGDCDSEDVWVDVEDIGLRKKPFKKKGKMKDRSMVAKKAGTIKKGDYVKYIGDEYRVTWIGYVHEEDGEKVALIEDDGDDDPLLVLVSELTRRVQ